MTLSTAVPDRHYFSGRGAKDILPLYRDAGARHPNLHPELATKLSGPLGRTPGPEDLVAYFYAVLAHPAYSARFQTELANREVRVPVTLDPDLFQQGVALGRRLIYLHSYGERFTEGQNAPSGQARCTQAPASDDLPEGFEFDPVNRTLKVGEGRFQPVEKAVFDYQVSGLKVVQSWLGYRMRVRKGRKSSSLDDITPEGWPPEFTSELLRLLHLLEATLALHPQQASLLEKILAGPLLQTADLPEPPRQYREAPASNETQHALDV